MIIYEFLIRHESSVTRREWSIRSVRSFKIILNSSCYQRLIRNLLYTVVMILLSLLLLNSLKWIVVITSEWYSRLVAHDTEYSFQLRFNFQNTYQQSSTSDRPIRAKSIDFKKMDLHDELSRIAFQWSLEYDVVHDNVESKMIVADLRKNDGCHAEVSFNGSDLCLYQTKN